MGRPGRPRSALVLSDDQRHDLEVWAEHPPEDAPKLSLRSQIVLRCAHGSTNREVARALGVSEVTVSKWCGRYRAWGLDGLRDRPRRGAPRSTDAQVQAVIVATLEEPPPDPRSWTTQSMAEAKGISASTVARIWRTYGLGPHRVDIFTLSGDPRFVGKVREVAGLYLNPPEGVFALWVDEDAPIQTADRAAPILPLRPWIIEHSDDDQRNATTALRAALEVASGRVIADPALAEKIERARDRDLQWFLDLIDQSIHEDLDIHEDIDVHVVIDHSSTKMTDWLHDWLLGHLRFQVHFTPTYGWWMAVVERWYAELANRGLGGSITELAALINHEMSKDDSHVFAWHWE